MKKDASIQLMVIGSGKMLGDFECIHKIQYMTSLVCNQTGAEVYVIKKNDFNKLSEYTETWSNLCEMSFKQQQEIIADYELKQENTETLKEIKAETSEIKDIKIMVKTMKDEQLWKRKPTSINLFAIKKHM